MHNEGKGTELQKYIAERLGTVGKTPEQRHAQEQADNERRLNNERARAEWREYVRAFSSDGELQPAELTQAREATGLSQRELGNIIGLPEDVIRSAENGKDVSLFKPALQRFVNSTKAATEEP